MPKTKLKLETVTPMFLHGADNMTPELRPPPFKALFRYWWRTVQDVQVNTLRKTESELFGSTDRKAPFSLRISGNLELNQTKYKPLPHKPDKNRFGKKIYAFDIEQEFDLCLITKNASDAEYCEQIAKLGFFLGGVGVRSRRGFGSIREKRWTFSDVTSLQNEILETLNTVAMTDKFQINKFTINGRHFTIIEPEKTQRNPKFPVIQRIFFGELIYDMDDLLKKIGLATSDARHHNNDDTLGGGVPRMASPVIVRIQKLSSQYIPIVTQLCSQYPQYFGKHENRKPRGIPQKQLNFINDII